MMQIEVREDAVQIHASILSLVGPSLNCLKWHLRKVAVRMHFGISRRQSHPVAGSSFFNVPKACTSYSSGLTSGMCPNGLR